MNAATRSFERFSAAAMECVLSRVLPGIYFRYYLMGGYELGRRIGTQVVANFLQRRDATH